VHRPKLIPIPTLKSENDYYTKLECGKRNSALISYQGEIWICGNEKRDKPVKEEEKV